MTKNTAGLPDKLEITFAGLRYFGSVEMAKEVQHRYNSHPALLEALRDCQDFLQAIVECTAIGRITEHSILRPGEKVKTTAHKLNTKAKNAITLATQPSTSGEKE